jgi:D-apiose dehydrogenase
MIRASDSSGIRLMFHENWRFRSWYRALRAEISAGTIGRPIRLRIARRDTRALREGGYDDQPYFRTLPRLTLLEMGCHLVDTSRFLIGEVETVSAALGKFGSHSIGEDVATLSLQFAGGCLSRPGVLRLVITPGVRYDKFVKSDAYAPVAQLDRASVYGTEGYWFESSRV